VSITPYKRRCCFTAAAAVSYNRHLIKIATWAAASLLKEVSILSACFKCVAVSCMPPQRAENGRHPTLTAQHSSQVPIDDEPSTDCRFKVYFSFDRCPGVSPRLLPSIMSLFKIPTRTCVHSFTQTNQTLTHTISVLVGCITLKRQSRSTAGSLNGSEVKD
jgi:hypothetical protein